MQRTEKLDVTLPYKGSKKKSQININLKYVLGVVLLLIAVAYLTLTQMTILACSIGVIALIKIGYNNICSCCFGSKEDISFLKEMIDDIDL